MVAIISKKRAHPADVELAAYLAGNDESEYARKCVETHLSECEVCLEGIISAQEAVAEFNKTTLLKKLKDAIMKKLNMYLLLATISFILSFITPRYFLQLLVATLLLGIKWVADSKTTKMLIMIHEAWKRDGGEGASRILETIEKRHSCRL